MARHDFKLPDIGEGIAEAEIARWRVAVGDIVQEDQALVDMLTEKAAVEVPSPVAGRILALNGEAGQKVPVGSVIVVIDTGEISPTKAIAPVLTKEPTGDFGALRPMTSPALRRRARERGIDLTKVQGTGPRGRITQADFDRLSSAHGSEARHDVAPPPEAEQDSIREVRIIGLRRTIAAAMQRSKQRIPHFSYVEELDVTELEVLRAHLNDGRSVDHPKLTLLPFLMQALVRVLPSFPQINARFDDEAGVLRQIGPIHVGVATQTDNGLLVTVVRHAEMLNLWQSAAAIKRLSATARAGKAARDDLSGSTITISSLGPMGGIVSTPIINAPEVAIIGVNKIVERPLVIDGRIVVRRCMNLSSSFDHRIVDGWEAATFIQRIKSLLEHPAMLFIEPTAESDRVFS